MYPNPQDVLPLPPRPDLDQYRKRAKKLTTASRAGDAALLSWAAQWIGALVRLRPDAARPSPRDLDRRAHQETGFARERLHQADPSISQAHFVLARARGFESWPRLLRHVEGLARLESDISAFERAADAIVDGDLSTLQRLVEADPALVRARSSREHRATLLHYVSANGVESYRQRTPPNIEAITQYLLGAGAEVDAEADVYGGLTTFSLVVPERKCTGNGSITTGCAPTPRSMRHCSGPRIRTDHHSAISFYGRLGSPPNVSPRATGGDANEVRCVKPTPEGGDAIQEQGPAAKVRRAPGEG